MNVVVVGVLLTILFSPGAVSQFDAKRKCIEYRLEIDGQRVEEELHVMFLVDGQEIDARADKVSFQVPSETESAREVRVRIRFGAYDLEFPEVFSSQLDGTWLIGIDTRPFEKNNLSLVKEKSSNIDFIYFIKFYPTEGAVTGVISYEKQKRSD